MISALSAQIIFFLALLFLAIGAAGSLLLRKHDSLANLWANLFALTASVYGLIAASLVLISGTGFNCVFTSSLPLLSISLSVDRLGAFFIFTISLIALLSSIYAFGYMKHYFGKYDLGSFGFFYNLFIAGLLVVVSAGNGFFFLVAWEIMSLASYFLVIFEKNNKENIKAGTLYFIMTHIGAAFIALSFLLLYAYTGTLDFEVIKANIADVPAKVKSMVFIFSLVGFGSKAGIIPFHIWLPSAHPAAPSQVSALMSGVMIKAGIYMMIRLYFDIMPLPAVWCGAVIIAIGSASALLGVLYALAEHDLKKFLAYSSIENIGIILLGLGSSLLFFALDIKDWAILGLAAALFHILNHAIFKALLFMGAGAVIGAAGTRNMEKFGGLIKRMPQTAVFFLAGCLAISALPPFNGFFSEYLTYQSLWNGIRMSGAGLEWLFILSAGMLAITGGLAAACFVRVFGAVFLARPRSEAAKNARESGLSQRLGMGALAVLALLVGVFSGSIAMLLAKVISGLQAFQGEGLPYSSDFYLFSTKDGFASASMPLVFVSLAMTVLTVFIIIYLFTKNRKIVTGRTWDCGVDLGPRMEITATGFSRSIITVFKGVLAPTKHTEVGYVDADTRHFPYSRVVSLEIKDIYNEYFYRPSARFVEIVADNVKKIQGGNVNIYILYIFLMLIALLLFQAA